MYDGSVQHLQPSSIVSVQETDESLNGGGEKRLGFIHEGGRLNVC